MIKPTLNIRCKMPIQRQSGAHLPPLSPAGAPPITEQGESMIISNSDVLQTASHHREVRTESFERLEHFRLNANGNAEAIEDKGNGEVSLSKRALSLAADIEARTPEEQAPRFDVKSGLKIELHPVDQAVAPSTVTGNPKLKLFAAVIASLTGKQIELFDASRLQAGSEITHETQVQIKHSARIERATVASDFAGAEGMRYEWRESRTEIEETDFNAKGKIMTQDGKEIDVDLALTMSRRYTENSSMVITAGAQLKDPLVINYDAPSADLDSATFSFDLDADGTREQVNRLKSGSGFLALDKNGNGKIDDGSELFGAQTGDGFKELAAYDDDGNGFIDEADSIFNELRVWIRPTDNQSDLLSLKQANVGAIHLGSIATPFDIRDSNNELLGKVRSTSFFLTEQGQTKSVQQIDLKI
jgi:hypothetical protein